MTSLPRTGSGPLSPRHAAASPALVVLAAAACSGGAPDADTSGSPASEPSLVYVVEGFEQPESVRYDPDQDVWFVGNFAGEPDARDGNGFVSTVTAATGNVVASRFAVGSDATPFHAARGMFLTGDTLWVNDVDGVHAFDRRTGEPLGFVDFSDLQPGFLNDIVAGPDSALYVTDTGRSAVYRIEGGTIDVVAQGQELGGPNGITVDADGGFVLAPWNPGFPLQSWTPGQAPVPLGDSPTNGRMDGVEFLDGRLLVASQSDSALHVWSSSGAPDFEIALGGAPADIGIDPVRRWVAIPFVSQNRVEVWSLPPASSTR